MPEDLKQIRPGDTSVTLAKRISEKYQEVIDEHEEGQPFNDSNIFSVIGRTFKTEIITIIVLFHISIIFRVAFSLLFLDLLHAVEANDRTMAYIWIAILSVIFYIYQLFHEQGLNRSYILGTLIKSALAMLLYAKVSKMTSFVMNSS